MNSESYGQRSYRESVQTARGILISGAIILPFWLLVALLIL